VIGHLDIHFSGMRTLGTAASTIQQDRSFVLRSVGYQSFSYYLKHTYFYTAVDSREVLKVGSATSVLRSIALNDNEYAISCRLPCIVGAVHGTFEPN